MSVIRQLPFIESLVSSLTLDGVKDLKKYLNEGGDNVKLSFATLTNSYKNKVTPVYFTLDETNQKTALLVWSNTLCALVCYHRFQDLMILELDVTNHTYQKINEYCDINELRRIVDDTLEAKGSLKSGDASENELPFADGEGGVEWKDAVETIKGSDFPDGSTSVKMVAIDDEGNLVKVPIPEGTVVVDSELSTESENPVQNKVINDALEDLKDGIEDGSIVPLTTKNIQPLSEESGTIQETPFISQGTGTANNTSETPTSPVGKQLEKQGNTFCYNQYRSVKNGTINLTQGSTYQLIVNAGLPNRDGDKVWVYCKFNFTNAPSVLTTNVTVNVSASGHSNYISNSATITNGILCVEYSLTYANSTISVFVVSSSNQTGFGSDESVDYSESSFINFTQWFGRNNRIPQDLLDNPSNFFRYYNGDLTANTGKLTNCDGRYLACGRRNIYNPNETYNIVVPNREYYYYASAGTTITYYDKDKNSLGTESVSSENTFTTPSNCKYINSSNTTSITISLYYETGDNYNENYPYEEPKVYDTGSEELLAFDKKTPDGTIYHNTQYNSDISAKTWSTDSTGVKYTQFSDMRTSGSIPICSKYTYYSYSSIGGLANLPANGFTKSSNYIYVNDSSPSGEIQYELADADKTTEQGTPFSENIEIDDYGTMSWLDTENTLVEVPQGCKIFYPADYVLLMDDLNSYTEGDVTKLAKKTEVSAEQTARESQDTILLNAIGGTLRQCLCVKESLDFDNTDVVDLGTLNWAKGGTYNNLWYAAAPTNKNEILCTKYKSATYTELNVDDNTTIGIAIRDDVTIRIKDTAIVNMTSTQVQNYLKGILLAYEKSS